MTIFYSFFLVIEPLRLWLGFAGNLKERVPDLAGCFLFTLFPQMFTCFYYMGWQPFLGNGYTLPFEVALNSAYCILLIPELYFCYMSAQAIIKSQAASFFLTLGAVSSDEGILQAEQAEMDWNEGLSRAA
ncbi:hypothetical protein BCR33DRAFT_666065 [Rhizoclosmatium globosum]|uniref:EXPERA domain-containing protein n=1 Tax=Rhizoclosmatium globosum TaxID=329046 RepID=A0A1Y2BAS2_9FUNG|nr:hypothetical protein BCR33DRAFT_666065 [Rhizoclosmatium globosum]|eukprot:ORY31175.1 hypothetical protein BCR33DRAFT_666065 [Rhizoclosmatium globosum]